MFVSIEIPAIGAIIRVKGEFYQIAQVDVKVTPRDDSVVGAHVVANTTLQRIDDEGNELDIDPITVNLDMIDYEEV